RGLKQFDPRMVTVMPRNAKPDRQVVILSVLLQQLSEVLLAEQPLLVFNAPSLVDFVDRRTKHFAFWHEAQGVRETARSLILLILVPPRSRHNYLWCLERRFPSLESRKHASPAVEHPVQNPGPLRLQQFIDQIVVALSRGNHLIEHDVPEPPP